MSPLTDQFDADDRAAIRRVRSFAGHIQDMPGDERLFLLSYLAEALARRMNGTVIRPTPPLPPSLEKVTTPPRQRGALRYKCPRCKAPVGRDCRTAQGLQVPTPHAGRWRLHAQATGALVEEEPST